ncbi:MAG: threonylcarbamoyl-AMP synthase [Actinobacteria bacterium]|nr:threonylcarbamoyl-AMP synthase [Actinomycetota bacterium]
MAAFKERTTELIAVDPDNPDAADLRAAAKAAREGALVVFPTDTVYGVGTSALVPEAARDIYAAKERPADKPLILLIADPEDVYKYVTGVDDAARELMRAYWPGALTLIFKKSPVVPAAVTAGGETVGVRCPNNAVARMLIRSAGVALATTSANIADKPSPKNAGEAGALAGRVDFIIDGGESPLGIESTVLDVSTARPELLREGYVTWDELKEKLAL